LKGGCQGFIGPLPSAFLDKYSERTAAKIIAGCSYFKIFFKMKSKNAKLAGWYAVVQTEWQEPTRSFNRQNNERQPATRNGRLAAVTSQANRFSLFIYRLQQMIL
jgi:hypothetical protein